MKRLLIACTLAVGGAGLMITAGCSLEEVWTTDSAEALREFELGLESRMKYYNNDAAEHFARAVELDPSFLAARLYLTFHEEDWERERDLQDSLRAADTSGVTPRERFLIDFHLAQWERELEKARQIAEQYTRDNPGDPYGLASLAEMVWTAQDWDEAERLYREILEIDPNWAQAQNRLGYIAFARGNFREAEELFETYEFIAPDQANPHDSMGELFVLLGRYEEAAAEFARALELRPDFCNTYQHLIDLVLMQGRVDEAPGVLGQAAEHCSPRMIATLRCSVEIWSDFLRGDSERVWSDEREECRRELGDYHFLLHRTACLTDRLKMASKAERGLKMRIEAAEKAHHVRLDFPRALLLHMEGTRLLAKEDYQLAAERFQQTDEMLYYWGQGQGILKLYNQVNLAYAQEKLGLKEESARTLERVREVNASFASHYPDELGLY